MNNVELKKSVNKIVSNPNFTVAKGTVGGTSIEVFVETPYEDFGSFIYKNEQDRDKDFDALQVLIEQAKQTENVR